MLAVKSLMLVLMLLMPTIAIPFTLVSAQSILGINVQTDSKSYYLGEAVDLFGNFTILGQPVANGTVGVAVYDSSGVPVAFRTVKTGPGTPPRNLVQFVGLTPCDETGAAQSSFVPGQTLYVMVTFKNNDDVDHFVMVPITVFDANGVPLAAQPDSYGTLAPDSTGAMLFMVSAIPSWATPGNATLVASIFSGYPQDGGTPYCQEESVNFEINRNPQVGYSTPPPTTAQTPNGTFASFFKLSPESRYGSYTVDVSAQSTLTTNGTYQSLSTVQDSTVFSVIDTPTPPQAAFTFYPVNSYVNMSITFDASASTAEGYNVTIASYQWNFGDGSPTVNTTNSVTTHTFAVTGSYLVTLNVTDSQGLWCTASKLVTILPPTGPTAAFLWSPATPMPNSTVTFNANPTQLGWNGSASPPIVNYVWNFGDGNVTSGYYPTIVHTYTALGNYTVTLTVTDASGFNSTATNTVTVRQSTLLGDINGDGVVDIYDAILLAAAFGSVPGDPNWNPNADFLHHGIVDIYDAIILSAQFGKTLSS
jgi:PKD repeat protein